MPSNAFQFSPADASAFSRKVARISGQNIQECYQCRRCTAGCPAVSDEGNFSPDMLIRLVNLGDKNAAINNEMPEPMPHLDINSSMKKTSNVIFLILAAMVIISIGMLIYFSINYFENYKKKEIESLIWEAAVKDYELKTLRSQLNPHFMFNAMNSIRALIEEDPESAKSALTKLSNILRYSLQMERMEKVSLEDEMEIVKNYLELESIRFEERLKYKINIENGSSKIGIPPMMIQTLVENGIKHGISKIPGGGAISITTRIDNSKLYLEIRNSGNINEDDLKNSNGFGVNNTKHRLNLLFGEEAKFSLQNEDEKNVIAKLEIPAGGTNQ